MKYSEFAFELYLLDRDLHPSELFWRDIDFCRVITSPCKKWLKPCQSSFLLSQVPQLPWMSVASGLGNLTTSYYNLQAAEVEDRRSTAAREIAEQRRRAYWRPFTPVEYLFVYLNICLIYYPLTPGVALSVRNTIWEMEVAYSSRQLNGWPWHSLLHTFEQPSKTCDPWDI